MFVVTSIWERGAKELDLSMFYELHLPGSRGLNLTQGKLRLRWARSIMKTEFLTYNCADKTETVASPSMNE